MIILLKAMRNLSCPPSIGRAERRNSQAESTPAFIEMNTSVENGEVERNDTQTNQGESCFKRSKNWILKNAGKLSKKII